MPLLFRAFARRFAPARAALTFLPLLFVLVTASPATAQEVCGICRQVLRGQYLHYETPSGQRLNVCSTCERTAARCHGCRRPAHSSWLTSRGGHLWCSSCLKQTKFCSLCGEALEGTYYGLRNTGGQFCPSCMERERCATCGVPMNQRAAQLSASKGQCAACAATAVRGEEISRIAMELRADMEKLLGSPLPSVPIRAATPGLLAQAYAQAGSPLSTGLRDDVPGRHVQDLGVYRTLPDGSSEILILEGLPLEMAYEAIAHELAHAWQHLHAPHCTDPFLVEGFAQWVAEDVCHRSGQRGRLDHLRDRPDFYGVAFRLVREIEAQGGGAAAVLKALRENRVPDGVNAPNPEGRPPMRPLLPWSSGQK